MTLAAVFVCYVICNSYSGLNPSLGEGVGATEMCRRTDAGVLGNRSKQRDVTKMTRIVKVE